MQLLERQPQLRTETEDADALIKEARRLRRRRQAFTLTLAVLVIGVGMGLGLALSSRKAGRGHQLANRANVPSSGPLSTTVVPKTPGALSVDQNGNLYLVDIGRDQVLRRLPGGRFQVVAGNSKLGFSGDGGQALHAQLRLQAHSGIAVASNGTVYIADSGNDRVRAALPNGRIETVAGGGKLALPSTRGASVPARSADLGGVAGLAIGANQELYIGARFIVRLTSNHKLEWVAGSNRPAEHLCSAPECSVAERGFDNVTGLAFDGVGNLVVSGGNLPGSGYPLAEIRANGRPIYLTANARGVGGQPAAVASGPNGSVVLATQIGVYQIPENSRTLQPVTGDSTTGSTPSQLSAALTAATGDGARRIKETFYGGDGIAAGTGGQIYADAQPFIGLTFDTIVQLSHSGRAIVLWRS
jgi:hypothetical protein